MSDKFPVNPILIAFKKAKDYFREIMKEPVSSQELQELIIACSVPVERLDAPPSALTMHLEERIDLLGMWALSGNLIGRVENQRKIGLDKNKNPIDPKSGAKPDIILDVLEVIEAVYFQNIIYIYKNIIPMQGG